MADALLSEWVGSRVPHGVAQVVILLVLADILTLKDGAGALLAEGVRLLRAEADQQIVLCLMFRDVPLQLVNGF